MKNGIMHRALPAALSVAAFFLVAGCKSTSTRRIQSAPVPAQPEVAVSDESARLITAFGEYRIGNTIIEANEAEGKLTVKHLTYKNTPGGASTSTSAMSTPPKEWPLHEGWFAYAHENGAYVWLYNGIDKLLVVERKETPSTNFTNTYGPQNAPVPIPTTVLKHLKEPFRLKLTRG